MNKQVFIDRLRAALNGRVSPGLVMDNVNYYEDYINTEIRKGRTEEEILDSLGDPRLIARTIIQTNGGEREGGQSSYYQNAEYQDAGFQNTEYGNDMYESQEHGVRKMVSHMPAWVWAIVVILVLILLFSVVFSILSFLAPVLLPILVVVFLVKLFRDWLN